VLSPNVSTMKDIPWPTAEILRQSEALFATQWLVDLMPLITKLLEWTFLFLLGAMGCGYGYVLFFASVYFIKYGARRRHFADTMIPRMSTDQREQDVIGSKMEHFPCWVNFPDYDRVEWINDILVKLWPKFAGGYATEFVTDFIQPEIKRILDRMQLDTVAGFNVKKVHLGRTPARVNGIKVYSRNTGRDQIVLDCEVVYAGDARVLFTLQGVQAEIKNIVFKGMARIVIKPLLQTFPFVGGFEAYFINTPQLEYGLGGIGTFAEIPGANAIVKAVVEDQIRSRFVWPNRFHMFLPIEVVETIANKSYKLPKPSGVLEINLMEARDLLKKDKSMLGTGLSDPYATVKIGERKISFRDSYAAQTVTPKWNYTSRFIMENYHGQEVRIEVFDYDSSSSDDFLGRTCILMDRLISSRDSDDWIKLEGVKKGDIRVATKWKAAICSEDEVDEEVDDAEVNQYAVSIYVDSCRNLTRDSGGKLPYPKCLLRHTQSGTVEETAVRNKTRDPMFEEGFMFLSDNVDTESISVEVVDSKSGEALLGRVKVPLSALKHSPRKEFFDMDFDLEDGPSQDAKITLSAKLYQVK